MKQTEAAAFLPIIQAWAEGKTIQYNGLRGWEDCKVDETLSFVDTLEHYRIKPEPPKPREWWVNVYLNASHAHATKEKADAIANGSNRIECVRVREVIEESNQ